MLSEQLAIQYVVYTLWPAFATSYHQGHFAWDRESITNERNEFKPMRRRGAHKVGFFEVELAVIWKY